MSFFPKQRVVVPIDFSDQSFAALDIALEITDSPDHVLVVHVLQELHPAEIGRLYGTVTHETREQNVLQALGERLADERYRSVGRTVIFDDPPHGIADFAAKESADLIVMPSHGRTGIKRLMIGSVAERVVRLAHCPVLVLRS